MGNRRNTYRNTDSNTLSTSVNTDGARITCPIHDSFAAQVAARGGASSLAGVLSGLADGGARGRISQHQRAARAWYESNGDVERKHTCGVYLRVGKGASSRPVLGVYVDTSARLTDFSANKELYLARLANAGLEVSGIEFRLSRKLPPSAAAAPERTARPHGRRHAAEQLPELGGLELREVERLTEGLPDALRRSASRAMSLSLKREKCRDT